MGPQQGAYGKVMEVLSMEADADTASEYRIQINNQVKVVVVQPGVYGFDEILSFPLLCSRPFPISLPATGQK